MAAFAFPASSAQVTESVTFPEFKVAGAIQSLSCSDAGTEGFQFVIPELPTLSGSMTVTIIWYADTATSGNVVWEAAALAYTPDADGDMEAAAFATGVTVTDAADGTAQAAVSVDITLTTGAQQDSAATGDYFILRIERLGGDGSDTMSGDAQFVGVNLAW